jgi:hypothetical protein
VVSIWQLSLIDTIEFKLYISINRDSRVKSVLRLTIDRTCLDS